MKKYILFGCLLCMYAWGYSQSANLAYRLQQGDSLFYEVEIRTEKFYLIQYTRFDVVSQAENAYGLEASIEKMKGLHAESKETFPIQMAFRMDTSGRQLAGLTYKASQESAGHHMDISNYFLVFPGKEISLGESWKIARAVEDMVFDSVFTSYTLEEVAGDIMRIAVSSEYAGSTDTFEKTITGEYLINKRTGLVIRAVLNNKSFTGFSHVEGQVVILPWNPHVPELSQAEKVERYAPDFAASCIDNTRIIQSRQVFIMNEANMPTFQLFNDLKEKGLLEMTWVDSSHCCRTYEISLNQSAKAYVVDSISTGNKVEPIVETIRYDNIAVQEIIPFDGYYEIRYQAIHLQPTPFAGLSRRLASKLDLPVYESSCFVREINGNWQIDKDKYFRGYRGE